MPTKPPQPSRHSGYLLSKLLEEIETTLMDNDGLARFANAIRRERDAAPSGHIRVTEWNRQGLLASTPYVGSPTLHGTLEDALRIAGDLVERGLTVQIKRTVSGLEITVDDAGGATPLDRRDPPQTTG